MIEIRHRYTKNVIYSVKKEIPARDLVTQAINDNVNLGFANLTGLGLRNMRLKSGDFYHTDLSGANLSESNFYDCNFSFTNLSQTILKNTDFHDSDLSDANLSNILNLDGVKLSNACLLRIKLDNTDIKESLNNIRDDFWNVLLHSKNEVPGLIIALQTGKINGYVYSGECCCLVGTLNKLNPSITCLIKPDSNRPIERWFLSIKPGDTPENSAIVRITVKWAKEFLELIK
jgi:hypothetical protein